MAREITPAEVARRLKEGQNVNVIDVRENDEVAEGKITGAKNIPLGHLAIRKDELDKNKEYIVVCHSGNRSKTACGILAAFGYKVKDMMGGMRAWEGELE